jgi:hypothetical protein
MAYVLRACADQAEAIEEAVRSVHHRKCHLYDVLPGGEADMISGRFSQALASGERYDLQRMIGSNNVVFDLIEKIVWVESSTVFGFKVCLLS